MTETGCLFPSPSTGWPAPSADWALFLDIDGTLLELAPTPSEVVIPPDLPGLLLALKHALGGAVALVSGRSLVDIDALFLPVTPIAAGQHGAEIRLPNGATERLGKADGVPAGMMEKIAAFAAARPGILVEDKGMTIAVHCRKAPAYQAELGQFLADLTAGHEDRLETIRGHCVFEIKPRNLSKRTAVERLMRLAPFAGRLPLFIGDDRTDEDGFAAVRAVGGHAIRVGPDGPDPGWATIATWRLADPACARAFLAQVATSLNAHAG